MTAFIPDGEYRSRLAAAAVKVARRNFDALLVVSNEAEFANVRYFSSYWPVFESAGVLIAPSGDAALLIGPESETYAHDRSKIPNIHKLKEYREPADPDYPGVTVSSFAEVFASVGVKAPKRVGIAGYLVTTAPMLDGLRAAFPETEFVRADDLMIELRSIKSPAELDCQRAAFRIAEEAVGDILNELRPGMTELQVVGIAQRSIYERGAEYEGMPQYVFAGESTTHAISRPTHRRLEPGDIVQLNISARVDGYSSGVGRPVVLGRATPAVRRLVDFGLECHRATIEWLKPGVEAAEIARRYRAMFRDRGFDENFLYGPCHGLGMIEVEAPWMEETSHYALEKNMTFQVDSFAFDRGKFGCRWENGVRISDDGVEMFSYRNMEIIELC